MSELRHGGINDWEALTRSFESIGEAIGRQVASVHPGRERAGDSAVSESAKAPSPKKRAKRVVVVGQETRLERGAVVRYRQGRGEFEARVVRVDNVVGSVTLERLSDGKRVVRGVAAVVA